MASLGREGSSVVQTSALHRGGALGTGGGLSAATGHSGAPPSVEA